MSSELNLEEGFWTYILQPRIIALIQQVLESQSPPPEPPADFSALGAGKITGSMSRMKDLMRKMVDELPEEELYPAYLLLRRTFAGYERYGPVAKKLLVWDWEMDDLEEQLDSVNYRAWGRLAKEMRPVQ